MNKKHIAKQLCHVKYQEEITKQEFHLLKQQIAHQKTASSSIELSEETFFNTIEDQHIRRRIHDQYKNIAQQAKDDMLQLTLSSAETQMTRYHQQFNAQLKQFWLEQRSLPYDQRLSHRMLDLIEQRYQNIVESVQCVYTYKANLIRLNSYSSIIYVKP